MSSIIDNKKDNLLVTEVNRLLDNAEFSSMAVGYFYLSGFEAIREKLHQVKNLRLVIGTRTNRATVEELIKGHKSEKHIAETLRKEERPNDKQKKESVSETKYEYRNDLSYMEQNDDNCVGLSALWELIRDGRVDIRVYTKGVLHSKAYIFDARQGQMVDGVAIVGSSNLTISGLRNNSELNVKITNQNDYQDVKKWFDEIWENSEPFSEEMMDIVSTSWVHQQATPYEVYIKTLYNLIKDRVQIKEHLIGEKSMFDFSTLFPFQRDAVNMALNKLESNINSENGVFISDVVGLGKSYIALAIISWYWSQRRKSTLVVCPAALKPMWEMYRDTYQLDSCRILSFSELYYKTGEEDYTLNDDNTFDGYEVVIIDEAHNFRNPNTQRYRILAPYLYDKKVVLLTATPQNKSVWDIYFQIKLFHQSDVTDLNISPNNLKEYFTTYEQNPKKISELLQNFMIRRTRNDIKTNPKYSKLDISFPKRILKTVDYQIDDTYSPDNGFSIYDIILDKLFKENRADRFQYSIYALTSFLKNDKLRRLSKYQGLSHFGELVRGLLRILLFKRLESSAISFLATLRRILNRNEFILKSIERNNTVITGKAEQLELFLDSDEIDARKFKVSEYPIEDFDKDKLVSSINYDIVILKEVIELITPIVEEEKNDAKFNQFVKEVLEPNKENKILVFSEFTETVEYLYRRTKELYSDLEIEAITSSRANAEEKMAIIRRFSPSSQTNSVGLNDIEKEIQILFTSDVLSEGQNLQDAHIVVNYDFHWNPVRLIQRIGRVDRIGSKADHIQVYNFLPDTNIESQLDLRGRVHRRINEIHQIFGSDSAILSNEEELNEDSVFAIYSDQDDTILDVDGGISTIFDEAEKILNQLEQDNSAEYNRIINLEDGIRAAKQSEHKGTFAFFKAGNFSRLLFNDGSKDGIEAIDTILRLIHASPNDKGSPLSPKEHAVSLAPLYKKFKQDVLRRHQQFSASNIIPEQKYFQERLKAAYNLFNYSDTELKHKVDRLRKIFQKEIPDYAKTELRTLKKQKLSDDLMIEALNQLVEKYKIDSFQNQTLDIDSMSIKTICSERFI